MNIIAWIAHNTIYRDFKNSDEKGDGIIIRHSVIEATPEHLMKSLEKVYDN